MSKIVDQTYLREEQYANATRLNARIQFHVRFSANPYDLNLWLFDQLNLDADCHILDLGCGSAQFWQRNQLRIPPNWNITLSDFSPGMLAEAEQNLQTSEHAFRFAVIDAQSIPYADMSFDAVIANYMLYHVPDREQAYAEVCRVLRPDGHFYAATVGQTHFQEITELARRFDPALAAWGGRSAHSFTLETGGAELRAWFGEVEIVRHPNAMVVTEAEPIVAFIWSYADPGVLNATKREAFVRYVEHELAVHGPLHVTKDNGLFRTASPMCGPRLP